MAGQPTNFQLPPAPLISACARQGDPTAQCCVDPAPAPWRGGCAGIVQRFGGNPTVLNSICCGSSQVCCPTETWGPSDDDKSLSFAPTFECCDNGDGCQLDTATGKGSCTPIDWNDADYLTKWAGMTGFVQQQLDGDGRCGVDGSLPLQIRPYVPWRCSLNILLPFRAECPPDATCTKDLQANANTGVCCRTSNCQAKTTCTDCVTPMEQTAFDALTTEEKRTHQPVCSWLTQGDRYNAMPHCVTSCRNFHEKSCIVGGLPGSTFQCPATAANVNGTQYNTGTCARRCGMAGHGRSSRINNNGNQFEYLLGATATPCCTVSPGDYCCSPWGEVADHCNVGFVPGGPQCGVPVRGSPNNFFNTAPYSPPAYFGAQNNLWNRPQPVGAYPPMGPGFGFPAYGGMYGGVGPQMGGFGGVYGGFGPSMGFPQMGGFGGSMYAPPMWRAGEGGDVEDEERQLFLTPQFGFGVGPRPYMPYSPRPAPYYGYGELPQPLDQYGSQTMCSCDDMCHKYSDCCADRDEYCVTVPVTSAPTVAP